MAELSREGIEAIDPQGMLGIVLEQPAHLTDAIWRAESAALPSFDAPAGMVVCGVGGSAIGADLAAGVIGAQARRPLLTVRDARPPSFVGPDWVVLCASYSGGTEETLTAFDAAGDAGAQRVVLTTGGDLASRAREQGVPVIGVPGGMPPRAAVAYQTVCALEVAAAAGVAPSTRDDVEAASALLGGLVAEWGPDAPNDAEPKAIAHRLVGKVPIVYGSGAVRRVAYRWKGQINENAKSPAFWAPLPEAHHNEICQFDRTREFGDFAAVFLEDATADERSRRRVEAMAERVEAGGAATLRVKSRGESAVERVMSLVLLGDLVSVYLAAMANVDPTPVEAIEEFKRGLG